MLEHTIKEAERLGLGVDMATGTGWPFGGPWVGDEDACKDLVAKTYELSGGERLGEPVRLAQKPLVRAVGRRPDIKELRDPVASNPTCRSSRSIRCASRSRSRCKHSSPARNAARRSISLRASAPTARSTGPRPPGAGRSTRSFRAGTASWSSAPRPAARATSSTTSRPSAFGNYLEEVRPGLCGPRRCAGSAPSSTTPTRWTTREGQSDWTPELFDEFSARRGYDLRAATARALRRRHGGRRARARAARLPRDDLRPAARTLHRAVARRGRARAARSCATRRTARPPTSSTSTPRADIPETEGTDIVTRCKFAVLGRATSPAGGSPRPRRRRGSASTSVSTARRRASAPSTSTSSAASTTSSTTAPRTRPTGEPWPGWLFYAAVELRAARNPRWRDFPALNALRRARASRSSSRARRTTTCCSTTPSTTCGMEPGQEQARPRRRAASDVGIGAGATPVAAATPATPSTTSPTGSSRASV